MKGIVFTEFLDLVEAKFSPETVEAIIEKSAVPGGGAYTAIGTYPPEEIVALVVALSEETKTEIPVLLRVFGRHLFGRFRVLYPAFFTEVSSALDFLETVERVVHVEVKKLYPDAELPRFEIARTSSSSLLMIYRSKRGLADLAEGLIEGCADAFGEKVSIVSEDLSSGARTEVKFTVATVP